MTRLFLLLGACARVCMCVSVCVHVCVLFALPYGHVDMNEGNTLDF